MNLKEFREMCLDSSGEDKDRLVRIAMSSGRSELVQLVGSMAGNPACRELGNAYVRHQLGSPDNMAMLSADPEGVHYREGGGGVDTEMARVLFEGAKLHGTWSERAFAYLAWKGPMDLDTLMGDLAHEVGISDITDVAVMGEELRSLEEKGTICRIQDRPNQVYIDPLPPPEIIAKEAREGGGMTRQASFEGPLAHPTTPVSRMQLTVVPMYLGERGTHSERGEPITIDRTRRWHHDHPKHKHRSNRIEPEKRRQQVVSEALRRGQDEGES
jgi:hypothetical protein